MLSSLTRFTTAEAFNAILLATLRESEAAEPEMYLDNATPRNATIGIGFNLTNLDVVSRVLVGLGYADGSGAQTADSQTLREIFVARGPLATMQREANRVIAARLGTGRTFAFPSGAAGDEAMNDVFWQSRRLIPER